MIFSNYGSFFPLTGILLAVSFWPAMKIVQPESSMRFHGRFIIHLRSVLHNICSKLLPEIDHLEDFLLFSFPLELFICI